MAKPRYDDLVQALHQAARAGGENLRCDDLVRMLEGLGFVVTRGSSGNHYTFTHPSIAEFHGGNFNGGSGRNPQLKPVYVRSVLKVLRELEDELRMLES